MRAGAAAHPVATDTRVGGDDSQTRFVIDFSKKVEMRAFTLADPYRVVIDLPQVTFNLPPKTGETGRGLVKAFRFGLVMQGGSRIVMDVGKPVRIDKAFVVDAAAGQPARLVVDLAATDRDSFMKALAAEGRPVRAAATGGVERENAPKGDPRPIIVLDPGHGGIDNGAVAGTGVMEKDIVLEFATELRDQLERSGKYRVVLTRTDDTFIPLIDRVRMARIRQAALFVSIHADAIKKGEGEAQGATVYTLSETASDADAGRLAETENRADVIAGIDMSHEPGDVADILIDLAQRETKAFSLHFARTLVGDMKKVARMHKNPMKSAGFKVLKAPDVPAVLIELGYVSSKDDLKLLTSGAWRTKTAGAVSQAIDNFFTTRMAGAAAGSR
ncbi:MAG: N-acetylmuramoyl-L-alanine amidase [Alphaproteobacteria bacterium]|nr:N-acetylmuramoyl-L-alanine amidase [Alphaproteobacteria bacterium]